MIDHYIFDACALLALLRDETGADIVADVINRADNNDALVSMHKVNFADTFALAETAVTGSILLTSDHHEMDKVEQNEPNIRFKWLR